MTAGTDTTGQATPAGTETTGWVVVTGAAGGIGAAVVDRLRADGYGVVGVDIAEPEDVPGAARAVGNGSGDMPPAPDSATPDAATPVAATPVASPPSPDARMVWVTGDLTTPAAREAVVAATDGRRLVGLVNVAGITRDARLPNMDDADVAAVLAVNAQAPLDLSLALAGRIVDGGAIVNISSRSHLGNFGQVNYSASKGAIVGTTIAMSRSLAPRVRVNAIAPGLVATAMTEAMPDEVLARITAKVPLGRAGRPDEVAAEVAHLLSSESSYTTGQVVYVCGGRSR